MQGDRRANRAALFFIVVGVGVMAWVASTAPAAVTITVGTHILLPNSPNQPITLFVSGGDLVQALDFNAQIGNGGPELGGTSGPKITSADILSGTIFSTNNTGQQDPGSFPQLAIRTTTVANGSVPASGLLATLMVNTTGFSTGTFALNLKNTLNDPTDFANVPVTINDGFIIVPEPATSSFLCVVLACFASRRRRRNSYQ